MNSATPMSLALPNARAFSTLLAHALIASARTTFGAALFAQFVSRFRSERLAPLKLNATPSRRVLVFVAVASSRTLVGRSSAYRAVCSILITTTTTTKTTTFYSICAAI